MPQPRIRRSPAFLLLFLAPVGVGLTLALGHDPVVAEGEQALIHRKSDYVGSTSCAICHLDQHASWAKTFHSTMTQRPEPGRIRGDFTAPPQHFLGKFASLGTDGADFWMEIPAGPEGPRRAKVALLVGSNRYQQYFERVERKDGFVLRRLPMLWHIGEKRWKHMSEVFLNPDQANWHSQDAIWNENCIFCHNTGPKPGFVNYSAQPSRDKKSFDSEVGELGISCEACHGPGRAHVEALDSPAERYAAHLSPDQDLAIVNPNKLPKEEATSVCGQCHGQRVPKTLAAVPEWLDKGPSFRPGDKLLDHVIPLRADTKLPGDRERIDLRFWADGTPRLSAYEYQGVTTSPCYTKGPMHCGSCHTMHSGSVHGNLTEAMRSNAACLQCHEEIGRDIQAHTHHEPEGSGSQCMDCHMPKMVYGILQIHRSHRIEIPDPASDAANGRPNACTLCHLDKSPVWAAKQRNELWGLEGQIPTKRRDTAPIELADGVASLLAGDAMQRVVYAQAFARSDGPIAPKAKGFLRAHLLVMLNDAYPSLRQAAKRSLLQLEREQPVGLLTSLMAFDPSWTQGTLREDMERRKVDSLALMREFSTKASGQLSPPAMGLLLDNNHVLDLPRVVALLNLQSKHVISIGE